MLKDKRKSRRQPMRYTAWMVLDGEQLHGCMLSDISDTGARLNVEKSAKLPDRFVLVLSGRGPARRNCRVVWRKPQQVGVAFERRLARADTATLVPEPDADADAVKAKLPTAESK